MINTLATNSKEAIKTPMRNFALPAKSPTRITGRFHGQQKMQKAKRNNQIYSPIQPSRIQAERIKDLRKSSKLDSNCCLSPNVRSDRQIKTR